MSDEPFQPFADDEPLWPSNYFNYFTEAEDHFREVRGTVLFRFSTLDWALVESWKNNGIPLEAILRGINAAFEKYRAGKRKTEKVNSVAYCTQAVMTEAKAMAESGASARQRKVVEAPFALEDLRRFLSANAAKLRALPEAKFQQVAESLDGLAREAETHYQDLEQLDQRLTALEDKVAAVARAAQSEEDLFEARRELDRQLRPYRGKMTADQLAMLEKQYLDRRLFENNGLPRLSLFYLR